MAERRYSSSIRDLGTRLRLSVELQASTVLPPGTQWIGGWVGPSTSLDDVEERKTS
jgi:hypothetical protein